MFPITIHFGSPNVSPKQSNDISRLLLTLGIGILTYELITKMVQKVAEKFFGWKVASFAILVSYVVMSSVYSEDLYTVQRHFGALCVAYVIASVASLFQKKFSKTLPTFMIDMVEEAKQGCYTLTIGYEPVVKKVEVLLNTTKKSNALLLGHPGVGKTTIPETIAYKIAKKLYPPNSFFARAKLVRVDFTDLLDDTKYRGALEKRVNKMKKIAEQDPTVLFFIDEIYQLVGGGTTIESSIDIAQLLLPAMARGEIRVLGASTFDRYQQNIALNRAFARRLPEVIMDEPTEQQCFEMLQFSYGENLQDTPIKVNKRAIAAAVFLTRKIRDFYYPDKAVDIIEHAISRARLEVGESDPPPLIQIDVERVALSYILRHNLESTSNTTDLVGEFDTFLSQNPEFFNLNADAQSLQ